VSKDTRLPSLKAIFSNWQRSDASFSQKILMVFKNNLIKLRKGKSCCGHYGEVGCWMVKDEEFGPNEN